MNEKILVVDDEQSIVDLLKMDLEFEGYQVQTASDGEQALACARQWKPDLILLDIMLPNKNGYEVCKEISPELGVPIILLTAKSDIVDKVLGLELGADDYITKPFDNRELLARVKAHLRRCKHVNDEHAPESIVNGPLKIIVSERTVLLDNKEIHLTPKEFDLLYLLATNLERVFTRDDLLKEIWGFESEDGKHSLDTRTVDMHIQRIRRKIDSQPNKFIQTVFRIGYKMRKI